MNTSIKYPLLTSLAALAVVSCVSSFKPQTGEVSAYQPSSSLVQEGNQQFHVPSLPSIP